MARHVLRDVVRQNAAYRLESPPKITADVSPLCGVFGREARVHVPIRTAGLTLTTPRRYALLNRVFQRAR